MDTAEGDRNDFSGTLMYLRKAYGRRACGQQAQHLCRTAAGLEVVDVFRKFGLDKFPQGDYRKSGSVLAQHDRSIGKPVLVLAAETRSQGASASEAPAGLLDIPAPHHPHLGLGQRYLYLQVLCLRFQHTA